MDEKNAAPSWEPETTEPPEAPPQASSGAFARLWMVFTSPRKVFEDIAVKPTWVTAMIFLVLVGVGAQFAVMPHVDTEAGIRTALEKRGQDLSEDEIENLVEQSEKFSRFAPVISVFVGPIVWAIIAAVFFLLLKIMGSEIDYLRGLSTTLHAYWPGSFVGAVLTSALIQRFDKVPQEQITNIVKASPGAFLSPDAPAWLAAIAGSFSVFNIWIVVLLILGFSITGKISKTKAVIVVLIPWVCWIIGRAALAALFG